MTTWRAIYERMFERGPDSFSQPERETIRAAIEEAWNAGVAAQRHPVSTLRERIEALAKEYEAHAARIPWGDKCDALMSHAQDLRFALESETREADPCEYAPDETVMNLYDKAREEGRRAGIEEAAAWCARQSAFGVMFAEGIRRLSTPPPANTENDQ